MDGKGTVRGGKGTIKNGLEKKGRTPCILEHRYVYASHACR